MRRLIGNSKTTLSRFNPRTRKGCDALAAPFRAEPPGYNPRTRKGCDKLIVHIIMLFYGFNPRTRKGCDCSGIGSIVFRRCFNPRTRKGCDVPASAPFKLLCVSIHAPVKDATEH